MKLTTRQLACLFCGWMALAGVGGAAEQANLPPGPAVEPELYATGFELAEGLALNPVGDLFAVNYRVSGTIGRIARDGTAGIFCDLRQAEAPDGRPSRANGLKIDGEGRLIVADIGAGRVLRISADGKSAEVLADRCGSKRFESIDDVALDDQGNIYFTDPGGSSVKTPIGSVYRYDINTTKVTRSATDLAYPTGLAVTPDGKHLCVAESQRYRIVMFDLSKKGEVGNRRVLIDFPTETRGPVIGGATPPCGMVFDAAGRLYVAMSTGGVVNVVDVPSGKLSSQYKAGGNRVANCHFHGDYLYVSVAAKEAVYRLKVGVKGYDYAGSRKGK